MTAAIKKDDYYMVSDYACQSYVEWFAETMTAYMNGNIRKGYGRTTLKKKAPAAHNLMRQCLHEARV
jgi:uncharacterized protein YuzB (UPF0349 family)